METETSNLKSETIPNKVLKNTRICLYLSGIITEQLSLVVPFFARQMENTSETCDAGCISLLLSIFAVVRLIASVYTGLYICKLGVRKSIVFNLGLNSIALLSIGLVPRAAQYLGNGNLMIYSFGGLCFGCLGWSFGGYQTALHSAMSKTFQSTLSTEMGNVQLIVGIATVVAPLIGGLILEHIVDDYLLIGVLTSVLAGICWVFTFRLMPEVESCEASKFSEGAKLLKLPSIAIPFISIMLSYGVWFSLEALTTGHISQFIDKNDALKAGFPWTLAGLSYGLTAKFWGSVSNKHPRRTMLISVFLISVNLIMFDDRWFVNLAVEFGWSGESPTASINHLDIKSLRYYYFCAMIFLMGSFLTGPMVSTYQEVNDVVMKDLKYPDNLATMGLISSCWNFGYALSNVIGPSVFGAIGSYFGFYGAMHLHSGCLVVLVVSSLFFYNKNRRLA